MNSMKKRACALTLTLLLALPLAACAASKPEQPAPQPETSAPVASAEDMATPTEVVEEGMVAISGDEVPDGTYEVTVDSSSPMFQVTSCELTVINGTMTAKMHMGGTGYLYVYPGTGEEAAIAPAESYIPFEEQPDGTHTFTIPVEGLDMAVHCAAFSRKKEMWYDRTLVFRADSLPESALSGLYTTVESLGLADGLYTAEAALAGGSGRASVASPAQIRVEDGKAYATIIWSSSNYDYVRIGEEKYLPLTLDGGSTFEIPIPGFDRAVSVAADTTAMSTPHEIDYTLTFDSATIQTAE